MTEQIRGPEVFGTQVDEVWLLVHLISAHPIVMASESREMEVHAAAWNDWFRTRAVRFVSPVVWGRSMSKLNVVCR